MASPSSSSKLPDLTRSSSKTTADLPARPPSRSQSNKRDKTGGRLIADVLREAQFEATGRQRHMKFKKTDQATDDSDQSLVFVDDGPFDQESRFSYLESNDGLDPLTDSNGNLIYPPGDKYPNMIERGAVGGPASVETGIPSRVHQVEEEEEEEEDEDREPRRCWICFSYETEDTQPMIWRTPCPCALAAHDLCLLDWIAELEAPSSSARLPTTNEVRCPQCQHSIVVDRPQSILVNLVQTTTMMMRLVLFPAVGVAVTGPLYLGLASHGIWSIYTIFGYADAERILAPIRIPLATQAALMQRQNSLAELAILARHAASSWKYIIGLPMIPVMLVLSRSSLWDKYVPLVPILSVALRGRIIGELVTKTALKVSIYPPSILIIPPQEMGVLWPPSPALCFMLLPYLRAAYNSLHAHLWSDLERKWLSEVQPRHQAEVTLANGERDRIDAQDGGILQLDLELGPGPEEDEEDDQPGALNGIRRWVLGQQEPEPQAVDQDQEQNINQALNAARNPRPNNNLVLRTSLMESIIGSLLFPVVASSFGELLKLVLPYAWTSIPTSASSSTLQSFYTSATSRLINLAGMIGLSGAAEPLVSAANAAASVGQKVGQKMVEVTTGSAATAAAGSAAGSVAASSPVVSTTATTSISGSATGLLQLRWGRALIGGCLVVLLKDSLLLYVRWRLAQNQRLRRIVDYGDSKARVRDGPRAGRHQRRDGNQNVGEAAGDVPDQTRAEYRRRRQGAAADVRLAPQ